MMKRVGQLMLCIGAAVLAACGDNAMIAASTSDTVVLTAAQIASLQSAAVTLRSSSPLDASVQALVDSALNVFTVGIQARRADLTTTMSPKPQIFVGIHRLFNHPGNSSSTWTVVGMDDPASLHSVIEVNGFAQNTANAGPESMTGAIGTGFVNALFIEIPASGSVNLWHANTGSATFTSTPSSTPCPNFTSTTRITCTLETMHVTFTASGSNVSGPRSASIASIDVPSMRLTYTF